jgi:hypothetical protein
MTHHATIWSVREEAAVDAVKWTCSNVHDRSSHVDNLPEPLPDEPLAPVTLALVKMNSICRSLVMEPTVSTYWSDSRAHSNNFGYLSKDWLY